MFLRPLGLSPRETPFPSLPGIGKKPPVALMTPNCAPLRSVPRISLSWRTGSKPFWPPSRSRASSPTTWKALILACDTKARLEDLYLPYKKRRKTKADAAREAGLEPLLDRLIAEPHGDPVAAAEAYVCAGFEDPKKALDGARAILIDRFALDANLVGELRETMYSTGSMESQVVQGKEQDGAKFTDYFSFAEPFTSLPSHRILALFRGEKEGVLHLNLNAGDDDHYCGIIANQFELDTSSSWLADAIRWGWKTKLYISSGLDIRMRLKETAEEAALEVFARNLKDVLLAAPAGQRATLG